ncbi:MAG TPA: archease [Thermoplasmata archaeon]|nr:archease [Thermoplasmata archaeon]
MARRRTAAPRPRYGSFPTTADVGIWANAPTPSGLFGALGTALFALMTDLRRVRPAEERSVSASGADAESLVVAYLTELLLLEQIDGFVGRSVEARVLGRPPTAVLAEVRGERLDPARHVRRKEVKAVTLHRLEIGFDPPRARVILDI